MKTTIIYTSLLLTTLLLSQENRVVKTIENGEEVEYIIMNNDTTQISTPPPAQHLPILQPQQERRWKPKVIQVKQPIVPKVKYVLGKNIQPPSSQSPRNRVVSQTANTNKKLNIGKIHGHAEIQHIRAELGDKDLTKSIYYLETGYETPEFKGVSAKVSGYVMGDTGFSDLKEIKKEVVSETGLNEAYVKYKGKNLKAKAGQFRLNTPLTRDTSHEEPNLYKGVVATSTKVMQDSVVVGAYISDIKKGGIKAEGISSPNSSSNNNQISILNIEDVDTSAELGAKLGTKALDSKYQNNSKVAIAGIINKSLKNTTIQVWEYYAFDVADVTYVDGMMKFKMANGIKTMIGAQAIHQSNKDNDKSISIVGIKGAMKYKKGQIIVAINKSTGDVGLHSMGGDPAYTSSKFSKNAYRPDVTAMKLIGKYNIPAFKNIIPKNLTLIISQAAYSKSSLDKAKRDGKETNIILKYKPKKNVLFVAAYMDHVNEEGDAKNQKVSYVAVKYKF